MKANIRVSLALIACALLFAANLGAGFLPFLADAPKRNNPNDPKSPLFPTPTPEGSNWVKATASAGFSPRAAHSSVVYNGRIWVIAGVSNPGNTYNNDVWSSSDGVNWAQSTASAAFGIRAGQSSVVYNNLMWVIGGYDGTINKYYNDVWYSSDGVSWTAATSSAAFSARLEHSSVVLNNLMWIIAGEDVSGSDDNDAWYSSDGITWTRATAAAPFLGRFSQGSVAYNSRMWSIAGMSYNAGCGCWQYDYGVWSSPNGVSWANPTPSPAFSARSALSSVVYDNKMWIIGGREYSGAYKNDVLSSTDGAVWPQATASAAFPGRSNHTSVVFNNSMWVIGGSNGSFLNDVWYSR